jgi:SAM-dependent methyltransferase
MKQRELSRRQFGNHAINYLTSAVHATGADLDSLAALANSHPPSRRMLDLGCGAGHASFALGRHGEHHITAHDPSPLMLEVVAREARSRGLDVRTSCGAAEQLPFADDCFDVIVTRYSAHHWSDVPRALGECSRVLAPGGKMIAIDVVSPEAPLLDTCLQVIEFLRDGSHVRNYRLSEWMQMWRAAGFSEPVISPWKLTLSFDAWVARIGTSPDRVAALRAVLTQWPSDAQHHFALAADQSFAIDAASMEVTLNS